MNKRLEFFIPSKTCVFGQTIKVQFQPNLAIGEEQCHGLAIYKYNSILIDKSIISDHIKESTYLHELLHHIFNLLEYERYANNETIINGLSNGLHQALTTLKYSNKTAAIPSSFMIFGHHFKIEMVSEYDNDHLAIWKSNDGTVIEVVKSSEISHDRIMAAVMAQICFHIFHLLGYEKIEDNAKLMALLGNCLYQALTQAEK